MIPTPHQPYKHYGLGAVDYHIDKTVVLFRRRKRRLEVAELLQTLLNGPAGASEQKPTVWRKAQVVTIGSCTNAPAGPG